MPIYINRDNSNELLFNKLVNTNNKMLIIIILNTIFILLTIAYIYHINNKVESIIYAINPQQQKLLSISSF